MTKLTEYEKLDHYDETIKHTKEMEELCLELARKLKEVF